MGDRTTQEKLPQAPVSDHGALTGLSDDDHPQYALLTGRSGGQVLIGGTASGNSLTLQSTSHATKGKLLFGTSAYDEVNNRLGLGTTSPASMLHLAGPSGVNTLTFNTPGGTKGRVTTASGIADWFATTINASYSGGWNLDDTSKYGGFYKLDTRSGAEEIAFYRIPTGANPHTNESAILSMSLATGVSTFSNSVGIGGTPTSRKFEIFGSTNTALMRLVGNSTVITEMGSLDVQGLGYVGTFSNHPFDLQTNNLSRWTITAAGHLIAAADNTYDFGQPVATRARNIHVGTDGIFGGKLDMAGSTFRVRTARTPASAGASGNQGDICWDGDFIYVATATNTWKRVAIATW